MPKPRAIVDEVGIDDLGQLALALADRLGVVDRAEVGVGPVARVEPVLPLDDHAEVLVVQHDHLDRQVLAVDRGQLLDVHQEAAVAVDVDDQGVGEGGLGPHRGGQAEAHRAEAAGGDPGPRPLELGPLGGPHLVLADAGGHDELALGQLRELVDDVLGQDHVVALVVGHRVGGAPLVDLLVPVAPVARLDQGVDRLRGTP